MNKTNVITIFVTWLNNEKKEKKIKEKKNFRTIIKVILMIYLLALMLSIKSRNDSTLIGRLSNYLAFTRFKTLAI